MSLNRHAHSARLGAGGCSPPTPHIRRRNIPCRVGVVPSGVCQLHGAAQSQAQAQATTQLRWLGPGQGRQPVFVVEKRCDLVRFTPGIATSSGVAAKSYKVRERISYDLHSTTCFVGPHHTVEPQWSVGMAACCSMCVPLTLQPCTDRDSSIRTEGVPLREERPCMSTMSPALVSFRSMRCDCVWRIVGLCIHDLSFERHGAIGEIDKMHNDRTA